MVFIVGEALVGAAIVLLRKTGNDTSLARAAIMAVHLLNTAGLTFFILFAARSAGAPEPSWRPGDPSLRRLWWGASLLLLVSAAGAVTALGDTVFPNADHLAIATAAANPTAHFLERVRGFHPVLAVLGAGYLWTTAWGVTGARTSRRVVLSLLGAQLLLGVLNVLWSAPGYMQIVHLGVANVLWLAWIWLILELGQASAPGEPFRGTSQ
jgi:heme A synthase